MLLELSDLSAGYGQHQVLRGVSLGVSEGETVALIGPNGAGKSTVLRSIMGLADRTGGQVLFRGQEMGHLPVHARLEEGVSFVPQGRLVFPSLSALENLEMGAYVLRNKEAAAENLARVFRHFPLLKRKAKHRAGSLSGGEQQMLAIGRALMTSPAVILLDEPSLGLAPKAVYEVFERLQALRAEGATLLIVEQNVRLVLRYAERGYLLAAGEVRFQGTAAELGDERRMHEAYLV